MVLELYYLYYCAVVMVRTVVCMVGRVGVEVLLLYARRAERTPGCLESRDLKGYDELAERERAGRESGHDSQTLSRISFVRPFPSRRLSLGRCSWQFLLPAVIT